MNTNGIYLFSGIKLNYFSITSEDLPFYHSSSKHILVIDYCKSGRIGWKTDNGNYIYLGRGDFSIHTLDFCLNSKISLPTGIYEGLSIYIDLKEFKKNPPELLSDTGITSDALYEKLCNNKAFLPFAGNVQTDAIFDFSYNQSTATQPAYQKLKTLELLLYLYDNKETLSQQHTTKYHPEQIETIRQIHEYLLQNLNQRITIEELSKQYLMNPTTMKALFKSVYGTSIAAHMKEHRMRKASELLLKSEMSIAEIALTVGYDSQSKFSTAFKDFFHILPKEYRKFYFLHHSDYLS